jgi:hypothetical protein
VGWSPPRNFIAGITQESHSNFIGTEHLHKRPEEEEARDLSRLRLLRLKTKIGGRGGEKMGWRRRMISGGAEGREGGGVAAAPPVTPQIASIENTDWGTRWRRRHMIGAGA